MHSQAGDAGSSSPTDQTTEVVDMAVNASVRAQAQKMQGSVPCGDPFRQCLQHVIVFEGIAAHGVSDAHQLLADDATGADGQVPDLGIAHLILGQADMGPAGFDQGVGVRMPEGIHHGRLGPADGVVL